MNLIDVLRVCNDNGIKLSLVEGEVKIVADKKVLTAEIISMLKQHKTLLADFLTKNHKNDHGLVTPVKRVDGQGHVLSFSQQRLWFINRLSKGAADYNIPLALKLTGNLNEAALQYALQQIVTRHESLRTVFMEAEGEVFQHVRQDVAFKLDSEDLSDLSGEALSMALKSRVTEGTRAKFDLTEDVMFRAKLLKLAPDSHVLVGAMHHIASDGWSLAIFVREFGQFYRANDSAQPVKLSPLPVQYVDYAHWQRNWLQGKVLDTQLGYWRRQLSGIPTVHSLPLDKVRPAQQSFSGALYRHEIGSSLTERLNALGTKHGATLFMTLQAAFSVLLSRYSNEEDIVIGTPIANRTQAEVAPLIGFFINTLLMRTRLEDNPSFDQLLAQTKVMALAAYEHQYVPFELLVDTLNPHRSLSHSPLFQIMFVLQNNEKPGSFSLPGLTLEGMDFEHTAAKFDLTLNISEVSTGLAVSWEYCTDLFEHQSIVRMAQAFEVLLSAIVDTPQCRVGQLPLMAEQAEQQLLTDWQGMSTPVSELTLAQKFEAQTHKTPQATALWYQGQSLSYAELNTRANRIAHCLQAQGVGSQTLVGLCVGRSIQMVTGMLGILKAGGAYVPLDPDYPAARLDYMLADAQVSVLLTTSTAVQELDTDVPRLYLDDDSVWADYPDSLVTRQENLTDHLAYVIYTSGSTGQPKGVSLTHGNAMALVDWAPTVYNPTTLSGVVAATSICFDLSVFEIFVPLCNGGQVLLIDSPTDVDWLRNAPSPRLINTVPSGVTALLELAAIPATVSVINLAGEPLSGALVEDIYAKTRVEKVYNLYGPSEDTTYSTFALIPRQQQTAPTIGKPLDNGRAYVLDKACRLSPLGAIGELHLAGPGLARGYLNKDELTAQQFIKDPFSVDPSARLYKTGDLVRRNPDGDLIYLGRMDDQVKVRGFRIELGEIEKQLSACCGVAGCVVLAREDQQGDKRLVAYYLAGDNQSLPPSELDKHLQLTTKLQHVLPDYMVPAAFVLLDEWPLTTSGKLDKKALPAPDKLGLQQVYTAPDTETEKAVVEIWARLFDLDAKALSITANFFELGGHSLLVIRLASEISQQFDVEVSLAALFNFADLAQLARHIEKCQNNQLQLPDNKIAQLHEMPSTMEEENIEEFEI